MYISSIPIQIRYLRLVRSTGLFRCPVRQVPDVMFVEFPIMEIKTYHRQQSVAALRLERRQVERLLTRRWIPHITQVWLFFSVLGIDSSLLSSLLSSSLSYQVFDPSIPSTLYDRGLGAYRGFHVQNSKFKGSGSQA
jgi:hypothetical protein